MQALLLRLIAFLAGPLAIIAVLRLVSGDAHIHIAAPAFLLLGWFIIDLIREKTGPWS